MEGAFTTLYRFHVQDPLRFKEHIRVTIERWWPSNQHINMSSVVFWYQQQPILSRQSLPEEADNHSVLHSLAADEYRVLPGENVVDLVAQEAPLRALGVEVSVVLMRRHEFLDEGALLVRSDGKIVKIPLPVGEDGLYRVELKPVYAMIDGEARFRIHPATEWRAARPEDFDPTKFQYENLAPAIDLGSGQAENKTITLEVTGRAWIPIHRIVCRRIK